MTISNWSESSFAREASSQRQLARLLMSVDASYNGKCRYCGMGTKEGEQLSGHFGILYGHPDCVLHAAVHDKLILSPHNHEQRIPELTIRAGFWFSKNEHEVYSLRDDDKARIVDNIDRTQVGALPHPCTWFGALKKKKGMKIKRTAKKSNVKMPPSCDHFVPRLIAVVNMPPSMMPDRCSVEAIIDPEGASKMLEECWGKLIDDEFMQYKKKQRALPVCPEHGPVCADIGPMPLMYKPVDLVLTITEKKGDRWNKYMWWACPGDDQ